MAIKKIVKLWNWRFFSFSFFSVALYHMSTTHLSTNHITALKSQKSDVLQLVEDCVERENFYSALMNAETRSYKLKCRLYMFLWHDIYVDLTFIGLQFDDWYVLICVAQIILRMKTDIVNFQYLTFISCWYWKTNYKIMPQSN